MKTKIKKDVEAVTEILQRIDPIMYRYVSKLLKAYGSDVTMSVSANIATTFVCFSVLIVERSGADVDAFMSVLLKEVKNKYDMAHAGVETHDLLQKIMKGNPGINTTCSPLH